VITRKGYEVALSKSSAEIVKKRISCWWHSRKWCPCPAHRVRPSSVLPHCPVSVMKSRAPGLEWIERLEVVGGSLPLPCPPVPPAHTQSTPVRPCVPGYQDQAPPAADKGGPLVFCSCCRCQFIALAWNCFLRWLRGNSNKLRLCQAILHRSTLYIGCLHWGLTEEMRKGWLWLGCLPACWCLWPWIYLQICAAQETGSCRGSGHCVVCSSTGGRKKSPATENLTIRKCVKSCDKGSRERREKAWWKARKWVCHSRHANYKRNFDCSPRPSVGGQGRGGVERN